MFAAQVYGCKNWITVFPEAIRSLSIEVSPGTRMCTEVNVICVYV